MVERIETPEERKERKRLKKLAKMNKEAVAEQNAGEQKTEVGEEVVVKKKKEKKKKQSEVELQELPVKKEKKRKITNDEGEEPVNKKSKVVPEIQELVKKKKKKTDKEKLKPTVTQEEPKGTFKKMFYEPTEATNNMSEQEVLAFQKEHNMNVTGRMSEIYKPIKTFADYNVDPKILSVCKDFEKPTSIQSQCWPIISSGRDIIGVAETGSGKTLAFSLPALVHMLYRFEHPPANVPWGPTMLVVAPTRELAMQSQEVLENAGKVLGISSVCCYGGVPKWEQKRALRWGVDVVVATPGRLKDLVQMGCVNLGSVSYLVLDEADRMLDQGFEDDIRAIIKMTHVERQTCLFSATWPEAIRSLAQEFLTDPVKVTIGSDDLSANKRITQIVEVVEDSDKDEKLMALLGKYSDEERKNRILIFVLRKRDANDLEERLRYNGWYVGSIHGDKDQWQRNKALDNFKSGRISLLVATDVAARGLDIPGVEYVINYSFPLTIEDYVHRIGRTGRAGKDGVAHSFFNFGNRANAGALVKILQDASQEVPKDMYKFNLRIKTSQYNKFFNKDGNSPQGGGGCFKCGENGHISRNCRQGFGGNQRGRFGGGQRGASWGRGRNDSRPGGFQGNRGAGGGRSFTMAV